MKCPSPIFLDPLPVLNRHTIMKTPRAYFTTSTHVHISCFSHIHLSVPYFYVVSQFCDYTQFYFIIREHIPSVLPTAQNGQQWGILEINCFVSLYHALLCIYTEKKHWQLLYQHDSAA